MDAKMSRWWRAHDEAVDDPKLQQLSGDLFKAWFNLCCVTSQNEGQLPDIDAIAFKLRMPKHKAAAVLTALHAADLLDKTETGFRPHNWDGRQYKSDVSNERVKQFRKRKRNAECNVTGNDIVAPPETEADTESDGGGKRDASDAFAVASELAAICGHPTPEDWPPGWCGSPHWVQKCLNEGWSPDVMRAETQAVARRKRDGPIDNYIYLEKPLARAQARFSAPLPKVEITQETIHATVPGPAKQTVHDAARSQLERLRAFDDPAPSGLCDGAGGGPIRRLSSG